jgi:hypothetical protein
VYLNPNERSATGRAVICVIQFFKLYSKILEIKRIYRIKEKSQKNHKKAVDKIRG